MTGPRPGLGIALVIVMAACFSVMDTAVRWMGTAMPVLLLLSARYLVQAAAMAGWLALDSRSRFRSEHPRFQLLRGALLLLTSAFSYMGLRWMPVAEFTAINMLTPVLVTLLAATLLKEPVSALRWLLVGGCFAGAIIVIRPGSGLFGWAVLFPLGCACCNAAFQVLSSRMAALESPYTTHFWTGLVGSAIIVPLLLASGLDVAAALAAAPASHLVLLLLVGVFGTVGHLLLILALGMAPTATLMPFAYTQLATAAVLGWLVFRYLPDAWGWVGMGVIAACGATSAWLNVRTASAARRSDSAVCADTIVD